MKIVFTEAEVKQIVLNYVFNRMNMSLDDVDFSAYRPDFCTVIQAPPTLEVTNDHHE